MANHVASASIAEDTKKLSRNYNLGSLALYVFPSVFTIVFIAIYQIVDGLFISNLCSELAVTSTELYYPVLSLFISVGVMLGTGANTLMIKALAEDNKEKANSIFTTSIIIGVIVSVTLSTLLLIFAQPIMRFLGATDATIGYLQPYYQVLTLCGLLIVFQTYGGTVAIGVGKSVTSAVLIVIGGILNCLLDFVFMYYLNMGVFGAAIATVIGYAVTVIYITYYSFFSKNGVYSFKFKSFNIKRIGKICTVGLGEFITNFAAGITSFILNQEALSLGGDSAVAAISVLLYIQFLGISVFSGIGLAIQPLFSYHYGKGNIKERQKIFRLSLLLVCIVGIVVTVLLSIFRAQFVDWFFDDDIVNKLDPFSLTFSGTYFIIPAMFFVGLNMFSEILFTGFADGITAAALSILRTIVLFIASIYIMSSIFGINGLWASWTVAEMVSLVLSIIMVIIKNKRFHYIK